MVARIGFVIASQSDTLARGVCEVVTPMAPDVVIVACGCHDEGLATAIDLLADACSAAASTIGRGAHVIVIPDLGPATLAARQLINQWGDGSVTLGHGPVVEGAAAGAVAAQQGEELPAVLRSIASAVQFFDIDAQPQPPATETDDPRAPRVVTVPYPEGLAARPAAALARRASDFDARVSVNGVDATSVLALMGLKLAHGDTLRIEADGPEAAMALAALAALIEGDQTDGGIPATPANEEDSDGLHSL